PVFSLFPGVAEGSSRRCDEVLSVRVVLDGSLTVRTSNRPAWLSGIEGPVVGGGLVGVGYHLAEEIGDGLLAARAGLIGPRGSHDRSHRLRPSTPGAEATPPSAGILAVALHAHGGSDWTGRTSRIFYRPSAASSTRCIRFASQRPAPASPGSWRCPSALQ